MRRKISVGIVEDKILNIMKMDIVRAASILNLILPYSGNISSITLMIRYILPIVIHILTAIRSQYFPKLKMTLSCEPSAEDPHYVVHLQETALML